MLAPLLLSCMALSCIVLSSGRAWAGEAEPVPAPQPTGASEPMAVSRAPAMPTAFADAESWREERDLARYDSPLVSLARAPDGSAWLAALQSGALLRSLDGGRTWAQVLRSPADRAGEAAEPDDEAALLEGATLASEEIERTLGEAGAPEDSEEETDPSADPSSAGASASTSSAASGASTSGLDGGGDLDSLTEAGLSSAEDFATTGGRGSGGVAPPEGIPADRTPAGFSSLPGGEGLLPTAVVWFAPDDAGLALAGRSDGIWRSVDGGIRWSRVEASVGGGSGSDGQVRNFLLLPASDILVAGTGRGIRESTDRGQSWIDLDDATDGHAVLSLAQVGGELFAGTTNGLYVSRDGLGWARRPGEGAVLGVLGDPSWEGGLWIVTRGGVSRSDDGGQSFAVLGRQTLRGAAGLTPLAGVGHLMAWGRDGCWESLDGGVTWLSLAQGLRDPDVRAAVVVDGRPVIGTAHATWQLAPVRLRELAAGGLGTRGASATLMREREQRLGTLIAVATNRKGLELDQLKARNVAAKGWLPRVTLQAAARDYRRRDVAFLVAQTTERTSFEWLVGGYACFGGCAGGALSDLLDLADSYGVAGMISADFTEASLDSVIDDARTTADLASDDAYYAINGQIIPENSDAFAATNVAQKIRNYRFSVAEQVADAWSAMQRLSTEKPPDSLQGATDHALQILELEARLDLYTEGAYTRAKLME